MREALRYAELAPTPGARVSGEVRIRPELDALYRRYGPMIERRCRRILGDPEEARDALHDIFLIIEENLGRFRGDSEPVTWLYRIATNHCLNVVRGRGVRVRHVQETQRAPAAGVPDPGRALDARRAIERLLAELDVDDVQILFHRYGDEMTQVEIAEALGLSERTVRSRLKRLEAAARAELEIFARVWEVAS